MKASNFGVNLKKVLNNLEMSQVELAKETGLTPAAISQIINGSREPRQKRIER